MATFTGIYTTGITLFTGTTTNPATLTVGAYVTNTNPSSLGSPADGVFGRVGTTWTVSNLGSIRVTGAYSSGIDLSGGGIVNNGSAGATTAFIAAGRHGVKIASAPGTVVNFATIMNTAATGGGGVYLESGGAVTNQSSGVISGKAAGIAAVNAAATVVNFGAVSATGTGTSGAAIYLGKGGVITNQMTGIVTAYRDAVSIKGGAATIVNLGTFETTGTVAASVFSASGGTLTNRGMIISSAGAVNFSTIAGTVDNFGSIVSTLPVGTARGAGVYLGAGGLVTNETGATINGLRAGVSLAFFGTTGAAATVNNLGTIIGGQYGVAIGSGDTGANTIINNGAIIGTSGTAISLGTVGSELIVIGSTNSTLQGVITSLQPGDRFDLPFMTFSNTGTATVVSNGTVSQTLNVVENGATFSIRLDPNQNLAGDRFRLSGDAGSGSQVTVARGAAAEDFDGDGASEILLNNTGSGAYVDWTMNGAAISNGQNLTFNGAPVALDASWSVPGTGDFNGDGKTDILLRNTNGAFVDWTMNGSAISAGANLTFNGAPVGLDSSWAVNGVADFNGDGKADILLHNTNGAFVDWTMNGSAITAGANLSFNGAPVGLDATWSVAGVGDFNGDGKADILLHNSTSGAFVDWTMNGSAIAAADNLTFGGNPVGLDNSWTVLGVGDLNGDGKSDILLHGADGSFVDWQMNGSTIAAAGDLTFQGNPVKLDSSWSFADLGDYNGDGKADILLRNTNGSFVDWTMNGATIVSGANLTFQGNPVFLDSTWRTT